MASHGKGVIDRLILKSALHRWARTAETAPLLDLAELRHRRREARQLRQHLDRVLDVAGSRLESDLAQDQPPCGPQDADWVWRPTPWSGRMAIAGVSPVPARTALGDGVTLFHDCSLSELSLRQLRNGRSAHMAPFALHIDAFGFDGSYLSLAVDLPEAACQGLKKCHLIRVAAAVEMERQIEVFARLNIRHGPNTEQIVLELPRDTAEPLVEFDLAYSNINEKRIERMWLDLIFEAPQMNLVVLRDMIFSRRPRAEL